MSLSIEEDVCLKLENKQFSKLLKTPSKNEVITSELLIFLWRFWIPIIYWKWNYVQLNLNLFETKETEIRYWHYQQNKKPNIERKKDRQKNVNNKTSTQGTRERRNERWRGKTANKRKCRVVSSLCKDSILVQSTGLVEGETKNGYNENNAKHALMNLHLVKNEWFAIYVNPNGAITFIHIKWNVRNIYLLAAPTTTTTAVKRKLHESELQDNIARVIKERKKWSEFFHLSIFWLVIRP